MPGIPLKEVVRAVVIALYHVRAEKGAAAQDPLTSFTTLQPAPWDTRFCSWQCVEGVSSLPAPAAGQAAPLGREESEPRACDHTVERAEVNLPLGRGGKQGKAG